MHTKIGVLLGVAWVLALGAASLTMAGRPSSALAAEAQSAGRIVVAQTSPRKTTRPSRRKSARPLAVQGAAPGWPTGIPVPGGIAAQDAAGPVPEVHGLSGPSFSDPGVNW